MKLSRFTENFLIIFDLVLQTLLFSLAIIVSSSMFLLIIFDTLKSLQKGKFAKRNYFCPLILSFPRQTAKENEKNNLRMSIETRIHALVIVKSNSNDCVFEKGAT